MRKKMIISIFVVIFFFFCFMISTSKAVDETTILEAFIDIEDVNGNSMSYTPPESGGSATLLNTGLDYTNTTYTLLVENNYGEEIQTDFGTFTFKEGTQNSYIYTCPVTPQDITSKNGKFELLFTATNTDTNQAHTLRAIIIFYKIGFEENANLKVGDIELIKDGKVEKDIIYLEDDSNGYVAYDESTNTLRLYNYNATIFYSNMGSTFCIETHGNSSYTVSNEDTDEKQEYLNKILDIIPSKMDIDLKEIEYNKANEIVETKVKEILQENGIDMQDLEKQGISYSIESSPICAEIGEFYKAYVNIKCSNQYKTKSIELNYNNHNDYNANDETYIKNLQITSPKYYEVDLDFLPYEDEDVAVWENVYNKFFNTISEYYTKQINDSSITIVATSGAGGTDGGLNLWTGESGTVIGIFKNEILYNTRIMGQECVIPVITVPSIISESEMDNYITKCITQSHPDFGQKITKIEKGTKDLGVEITNGYTIYSDYGVTSYVIVRLDSTITLEDSTTGIKLQDTSNILSKNVELSATKIVDENILNVVDTALNGVASKYTVYDITLLKNDEKVQPNGKIKISIPIPEGIDISKLTVYRISDNGEKIEYNVTVEMVKNIKYATFDTDHFSTYVLAEKKVEEEKDDTLAEGVLPNAGVGISIITLFFTVVVISAIIYNKYRKMKDIK